MPMTSKEMIKLLEANGFIYVKSGDGSHRKFRNPKTGRETQVPLHLDFGATEGEDLKDAFFMASDYLGAWLYEYYIDGKEFPIARDIKDLEIEVDEFSIKEASFVSLVGVDMLEYARKSEVKTVRRNVSIPSYLNELAKRNNINVSQLLQEALKEEFSM